MERDINQGKELSQEARAVLSKIAEAGNEQFRTVLSVILETKGDRGLVARKVSQAVARGNQKMLLCLALLEPLRAQDVLTGIYTHLQDYLEEVGGSDGLAGVLESLEERWRQDHASELQERVRQLEEESKRYFWQKFKS